MPIRCLRDTGVERPSRQTLDISGLLGKANEHVRGHKAATGMNPAHESLCAADLSCLEVELRLVVKLQFALIEGLPQLAHQ